MASVYDYYTVIEENKEIPLAVYTRWGQHLSTVHVVGTHVHYYSAGQYGFINCKRQSTIKVYAGTVNIPVVYDYYDGDVFIDAISTTANVQNLTVDDNSWGLSDYSWSGNMNGTFSFRYGTEQQDNISLKTTVTFESQNVSFTTYASNIARNSNITITGKRNSPIEGDTGNDTSIKQRVTRYYTVDKWTCKTNGNSANWGGVINAYFDGSNSVMLRGTLKYSGSSFSACLDELPIPQAPYKESTDTIQLVDDSVVPEKIETHTVTRARKYEFHNWNTRADGSGTAYGLDGKDLSTSGFLESVTLYAQWKDCTLSSSLLPSDWTSSKIMKLSSKPSKTAVLRCFYNSSAEEEYDTHTCYQYEYKGVKLTSWRGTDNSEIPAGSPAGGSDKYVAVWSPDVNTPSTYLWEDNEYLPDPPTDRAGWTYSGLSSDPLSRTPEYENGSVIVITDDMNLYAIWKPEGSAHLFNGSDFMMYHVYIYDGEEWKVYLPKIYNGFDWETIYM